MKVFKTIGGLLAALMIAACAGPAPDGSDLDPAVSKTIQIRQVNVDVSAIGPQTKGRALSASTVREILSDTAVGILVGAGTGERSAVVDIQLSSVEIITGGQAFMLGGESVMKGQFRLTDAINGEIIIPATKIESGGGGWVLGGIVAAATLDDPRTEVRELSEKFADRVLIAVFGE